MASKEHDDYVRSVFGIDPAHYEAGPSASSAVTEAGSPAPSPAEPPGGAPPKPKQPVITHETEARTPGNRARTKVGVGERVTLKVDPGPGKWLVSGGKLSSGTGAKVTFTAGDKAGRAAVSVEVGGLKTGLQFEVVAPTTVTQVTKRKVHHAVPQPNAGFVADIFIGPADVSFANVNFYELEVMAIDSGYWTAMSDKGHHPATAPDPGTTTVTARGTKLLYPDNIFSGYPGVTVPPFAGSRTWNIPWQFQVGSGAKHQFATVTQSIVSDAAGTTTASKAGASSTSAMGDPAA